MTLKNITASEYSGFQTAYDFYNTHLFGGTLPECLITLQRHANSYGYFCKENFKGRGNELRTDEIALNPDEFDGRTDGQILSTLVHEMCHLWQSHFGTPGRSGYHNREWAQKMLEVGLEPVSYDFPGKYTGQKVSHTIKPGDAFEQVTQKLLELGFQLSWQSNKWGVGISVKPLPPGNDDGEDEPSSKSKPSPKKDKSKVKFSCSGCKQNAWAKESALLVCGHCGVEMVAQ